MLIFLPVVIACSMVEPALKEQGHYPSPGGACIAVLKRSPLGGFLQLFVQKKGEEPTHVADDVTGFLWITKNYMVYSASPIYGKPGIYELNCDHDGLNSRTILNPVNYRSSYPDGADYFELKEIRDHRLIFFYGPDVDNIDFNTFRTGKNLRLIVLP